MSPDLHSGRHVPTVDPATSRRPVPGFDSPESFAQVVEPHLPLLHRAAQRFLSCEDRAKDVVQETLLRIWARGWLPDEPVGALLSLVRKSCLHQLRCDSRRSRRERNAARERLEPCCSEDPRALLERGETAKVIQAAIERIADGPRIVLELYEFEGATYEEIASLIGVPIGTVRSRLSRARRLLRSELERQGWAA